jgi:drug/metabolite transporter (DMT)-like permease
MVERLGNVLYWACCIVALVFVAGAVLALMQSGSQNDWAPAIAFGVLAAVAYGVGRGLRYVLAGK